MEKKEKKEIIKKLVEAILCDSQSMIRMLIKFGDMATSRIDHGQLHINYDDRVPSGWNQELLKLFPLRYPVAMTSWKGTVSVCFLDELHCFDAVGTREMLEYVLEKWGDESRIKNAIEHYDIN